MSKNLVLVVGLLFFMLFGTLFVSESFAQCSNYFKTNYHKIFPAAGSFLQNDWNGDGKLDFWNFQTNSANSTFNILIYPGKAGGYWDWDNPIVYTTDIPSATRTAGPAFIIKDFDNDGDTDFLFANRFVRNNGNGSFTMM